MLHLPSPGSSPEFLSLARRLDLLFGPWTRSIFRRGSGPNLWPGRYQWTEPRAACLRGTRNWFCLQDGEAFEGFASCSWHRTAMALSEELADFPGTGPKAAGTPPPTGLGLVPHSESQPLPSLGCFKGAWKHFHPTVKHQSSLRHNPTNQSYTLFAFLQRPFHFSSVKIYFLM